MSDAGRALAVTEAYEWAIDLVESMHRDEALDHLRRVAARNRRMYEEAVEYARIARILGPARPADEHVMPTAEPDRVIS